jgi:hypothetical protein
MSGLLLPASVSPTVVGVGVVRTSCGKITIIRASRWSQTLDRHALASGEPPWGIEPQTYALRGSPAHDGGRWLVSFDAGLFVTVGGCRRPMMDGRGMGARGLLDRFVPNQARPGCRRPLAAQREYVGVRSVHLLRRHRRAVSQAAAADGLVSSHGPAPSGDPSRRHACPQWCLGPPVKLWRSHPEGLGLDGRVQVPLAPWVPT